MLSRRYVLLSLLLGLVLLVLSPTVPAAGVRPPPPHAQNASRGLFPLVTWLRDNVVEMVFGRPASAKRKSAPPRGMGALNPRYDKETVIRFNVSSHDEEGALADAADRLFLDVWASTRNNVDIRLHKKDVSSLLSLLPASLQSAFSTLIPDLPAAVLATYGGGRATPDAARDGASASARLDSDRRLAPSVLTHTTGFDNVFFHDYQPLTVIYHWMRLVASMFPGIVTLEVIGKSFEGREILALRVGKPAPPGSENATPKKTLVVNGGLHAREWIGTAAVNYLAWSLISSYGQDSVLTRFLDNYTAVFIPVLNPDGYEYTWAVDRLWRKTRQDTPLSFCRGLDLDRAFGFEWDRNLPEPCSESYGGEQPFQAVEARQLSDWAKSQAEQNGTNFVGLIDLHSFSQEILYPYSYTCDSEPPNLENLEELAIGIAKAVRLSSGELYNVFSACQGAMGSLRGSSARRMESGGGSAIDWFYHEMRAKFSYQIKLRDRGIYGFLLPPEEIVPTGEEMFHALKYYADFLLGNNGIERSVDGKTAETSAPLAASADDEDEDDEWEELRKRRRRR
ncbi:hypothetical protein RB596_004681 [Gaeumannomyces avenae]